MEASILQTLPGELTAEEILNGVYPYPESPRIETPPNHAGFASDRLSQPPLPGVHPRILLSPGDLGDLRDRLTNTRAGRALMATLRLRVAGVFGDSGNWEVALLDLMRERRLGDARSLLQRGLPQSTPAGHYQPHIPYALVMAAFDAMVADDEARGRSLAQAIAGYALVAEPFIDDILNQPLADDVWRAKAAGPHTGAGSEAQGVRELLGGHLLGYAYDFAHEFMSDTDRAHVRRVIAKATHGRIFMGASLPRHFRNWNWVMCAMGQPLLALAIEGEDGYDPRVYRMGVDVARDYLTYGISRMGSSTEAVGYSQFGFVWAAPFFVAAARRGDNLLLHPHHRAMIDWYVQSLEPFGPRWQRGSGAGDEEQLDRNLPPIWTSHGDGGDEGPSIWTMMMWKRFFPNDPKIDFIYRTVVNGGRDEPYAGRFHIIEPLLWAADYASDSDGRPVDYADGKALGAPLVWLDPDRGSLVARTAWAPDALAIQFECRTDSVGASHEHADRGNFTLSALGRSWAKESFRSVETRHHNCVLIDGAGQGYWPGPGEWLGMEETDEAVIAACDCKPAYDWRWPKAIVGDDPERSPRFRFPRWASYRAEAERFQREYGDVKIERDMRPSVVSFFQGFETGDPRLWDEDGWPIRVPHNPVQRAFRTIALAKGDRPYVLVVDDIQKDAAERLYEWLMITGPDTDVCAMTDRDVVLCDATVPRDALGRPRPSDGDRQLLVRVLDMGEPARPRDYQNRPSARLETFEKRDTLAPNGRSFGVDRRLVIGSRSVAPDFKILLYPHRRGEPLPTTTWSDDRADVVVKWPGGQTDRIGFIHGGDGRTRVRIARG